MGLKTTKYKVKELGIVLETAYAQIRDVHVAFDGEAHAMFAIQQTRDSVKKASPIETVPFECVIDKDQPVHKQVYEAAKAEVFKTWEDDIVTEGEE